MRFVHAVNAALATALVVLTARAAGTLPDRMPHHFALDGTADAWGATTPASVWMLPLVGLGTALLFYAVAYLAPRRPGFINLPGVAYASLAPEAQARVARMVQAFLYASATGVLVLFGALQWGTFVAAATGRLPGAVLVALLTFVVVSVLATPILLYKLMQQAR